MKIKSVSAVNLKVPEYKFDLSGMDLLVAPNGSGKSARVAGVVLSTLGYIPPTGRKLAGEGLTPSSTMELSRDDEMSVSCAMSDGFTFSRTWQRKGSQCTQTIEVEGEKKGLALGHYKGIIADRIGSSVTMFDPGSFLAQSPDKRRDALKPYIKTSQDPLSDIRFKVYADTIGDVAIDLLLKGKAFNDMSPAEQNLFFVECHEALKRQKGNSADAIKKLLDDMDNEVLMASKFSGDETSVQLDTALSFLDYALKESRRSARGSAAAIGELQKSLNEHEELSASLPALEAKLTETEKNLSDVVTKINDAMASKKRIVQLEEEMKSLNAANQELISKSGGIDEIAASIETAKADLKQRVSERDTLLKEWKEKYSADYPDFVVPQEIVTAKDAATEKAVELGQELAVIEKLLANSENKITCPSCGFSEFEKSFEDRLVAIKEELISTKDTLDKAHKAHTDALPNNVETKAIDIVYEMIPKIENQIERLQKTLEDRKDLSEKATAIIETNTKRIDDIGKELSEIEPFDTRLLEAEKGAMETEKENIQNEIRTAQRAQGTALATKKSIIDAKENQIDQAVLKGIISAAKAVRNEAVDDIAGPLAAKANELISLFDKDMSMEFRLTEKEFTPIITSKGISRAINTLSGGELVAGLAALSIALTSLESPPLRVLCLEAAEIDTNRMVGLLNALGVLYRAGHVDNIVVATWSAEILGRTSDLKHNWSYHKLEA